ncbi:MAG: TIGR02757 family protein [Bacteroidia bacterium]|nr:TIGR02757 family protein [Bacteroidia bacterium]MDW8159261.1 TIGR02757 family protein [Bacteroidia bacterium]
MLGASWEEIKEFLDFKVLQYNAPWFIENDPIVLPHRYRNKEDIEIAAFLVATIAWGNRKVIIQKGGQMLDLLGESPYEFVISHKERDLESLQNFVHRTFKGEDLIYFVKALRNIYEKYGGLECIFAKYAQPYTLQPAIHAFRNIFFELPHPSRTQKHVADPLKGSSAKRINMFLRWMVRIDKQGVDFGIWKTLHPGQLSCPLDIHSGNVARKLGLLKRKQNDALAVQELDAALRILDPVDPVRYDFALFGLGVFEKF